MGMNLVGWFHWIIFFPRWLLYSEQLFVVVNVCCLQLICMYRFRGCDFTVFLLRPVSVLASAGELGQPLLSV